MKIEVKEINLKNYRAMKSVDVDIAHTSEISGRNGVGKSTIMNAYFDILTGKNIDGSVADNVRPHDVNGVDIDRVPVKRAVSLSIDGKNVLIEKETNQKWTKKRGSVEEVFTGNVTTYAIDGFDKKAKDFDEWMNSIIDPGTFIMCSNPNAFLGVLRKSTNDARKVIGKLANFDETELESYKSVMDFTKGHSIEDCIKQLTKNLRQQTKDRDKAKINLEYEVDRNTEFVDTESVKKEIEEITGKLNVVISDIAKLEKIPAEIDALQEKVMNAKFEKSHIIQELSADINNKRRLVSDTLNSLMSKKTKLEYEVSELKRKLISLKQNIDIGKDRAEKLKDQHKVVSEKEYNEKNNICPTCGQRLSDEKIEKLKSDFQTSKNNRLTDIVSEYNSIAKEIAKYTDEYQRINAEYANKNADIDQAIRDYKEKKSELDSLPTSVAPTAELDEIDKRIMELEIEISKLSDKYKECAALKQVERKLSADISARVESVSIAKRQAEAKEKLIEELRETLMDENQKCADLEMKIDMLKDFSIEKNKALSDKVNSYFDYIKMEFFDTTQEGNVFETLRIKVNGTDYMNGLNHGSKILADIDLVRGLQKMNGILLPIWVDDAESLDSDRIPDIPNQLIMLRRTDNDLKVEEV